MRTVVENVADTFKRPTIAVSHQIFCRNHMTSYSFPIPDRRRRVRASALHRPAQGVGVGVIIAITTGTQLRAFGPLGFGEVLLAGWIMLTLYRMAHSPPTEEPRHPLNRFWAVVVPVLMIGPVWARAIGKLSPTAPRDFLALGLVALFCFCAGTYLRSEDRERIAIAYAVTVTAVFLIFYLVPQVASALGVTTKYYGTRYVGWAQNPNQVAIDMVWVPFILTRRLVRDRSWRVPLVLLFFGSLLVGWISDSDSLRLGWGFGVLVIGVRSVFSKDRSPLARQVGAAVFALVLGVVAFNAPSAAKKVGSYGDSLRFQQGTDDGGGRGRLQRHAVIAAAYSPVIGLGPGLYSGLVHPFTDEEAHNTALDFLMKTGAVGAVCLVVLCRRTWRKAVTDGWAAVGAFSALMMFTTGHNVLRHPASWLLILLVAGLPEPTRDSGLESASRPERRLVVIS